jgi:hypothetical protein
VAGYGTDEGFNAWLSTSGLELPVDAPAVAALRERGSVYIDATYGPRFIGTPTTVEQEREWPRTGAEAFGTTIASDAIPSRVVIASYHAAYIEATNPGALTTSINTSAQVKRERVEGAVEVEYFDPPSTDGVTGFVNSTIEGLLYPLLGPVDAFPMVMVV